MRPLFRQAVAQPRVKAHSNRVLVFICQAASGAHAASTSSQTPPSPKIASRNGGSQDSKAPLSSASSSFASMITARRRVAPIGSSISASQQFETGFSPFSPPSMAPGFFHQRSFTQGVPSTPVYMNGYAAMQSATQYTVSQRDQTISVMLPGNKTPTFTHSSFSGTGSGSLPRLIEGDFPGRNPFDSL